jgi:hypothetical protein
MISTTKETMKKKSVASKLNIADVFSAIAARTILVEFERTMKLTSEGNNPRNITTKDENIKNTLESRMSNAIFENIKDTLENRISNDTVCVKVYNKNGNLELMSVEYADIKSAYLDHSDMWFEDVISCDNREGFCYNTEDYYVVVLGKDCIKYALDKA